jgi:methyl-accepting chemotaxis protein
MDQNTLLLVLTIFVAIVAIAFLAQAIAVVVLVGVLREFRTKVMAILPEVQAIIGVVRRTSENVEKNVERIGETSNQILDATKRQVGKVDQLLSDASTRAKAQMERAEMVLDDTMGRVQHTVTYVQAGVLRPVREVYGIMAGVRTALRYLTRGSRATVDHATADEEMFI